jgi:hypothetical protein
MAPGGLRKVAVLATALCLAGCAARSPAPAAAPEAVPRGCPPERPPDGEVRLVFLGDAGYGAGTSEWGTPGQEAVAARIDQLKLSPDLVFFLGDNIYWVGSTSLYKVRFDDVYEPLIRDCKVHVALGNHDVKGCRAVTPEETEGTCLDKLGEALVADRTAQYVRQGMDEEAAQLKAREETLAEVDGPAGASALRTRRTNCFPADASAYADARKGACHAAAALEHAQFGFGTVGGEGPEADERQRYYSILYPLPRLTESGAPAETPQPALVEVVVLDSNTLRVHGGQFDAGEGADPRQDQLQLLWLRSTLASAAERAGSPKGARPWQILAMHHAPHTPRACACRLFGACLGGHGDLPELQQQLRDATKDLPGPDLVMAGHNHIYARSHPLDAAGEPAPQGTGATRYFVTGGGGAPLYAIESPGPRWAKALTIYHFVYVRLTDTAAFFWTLDADGRVRDSGCFEKGSNVDRPLARDFRYDDPLPPRCAPP